MTDFQIRPAFYFFISVLAVSLWSCKARVNTDRPDTETISKVFKPEISTVNLPIELRVDELQKQINDQFNGVIFSDDSYTNNDNDDLKLKVSKTGDIKLRIEANTVYYTIPLNIWVKMRKVIFGQEIAKSTNFSAVIKFKTAISIDNQWGLETATEPIGFIITKEPTIDFGFVQVPITSLVKKLLDGYLGDVASELDTQIKSGLDTRSYVSKMYTNIQRPILISEEFRTWVKIKPTEFFLTPFRASPQKLKFDIGMRAYISIVSGVRPAFTIDESLPDLNKVSKIADEFQVDVATEISFVQATKLVRENLVGFTYTQKKKVIKITDAEVFGNGDKLVVKVSFDGSAQGDVYLTGNPEYDSLTSELYVANFDFDVKSKKAVLKVADWMAHGAFRKKVQELSRISVQESVDEASKMIETSLRENPIGEELYLDCKILDITPKDIYMTSSSIRTMLHVKGKSKIRLGQ